MNSGSWSAVAPWPIVAIHSVVTPDGKILTFGTDQTGQQGSHMIYDLWDPATGLHQTLSYSTNTNIFCSCCVIDPITDQIIIAGGDASTLGNFNGGVPYTHTFDYHSDQLTLNQATPLNYARWYATSITLADGSIFLIGGSNANHVGSGTPERYISGSGWHALPGVASADIAANWYYPRAWVSSSGTIFGFSTKGEGAGAGALFKITTGGAGSIATLGHTPFESEELRSGGHVRAGQDPDDRQKRQRLDHGYQRGDADFYEDWWSWHKPGLVEPYGPRRWHRPFDRRQHGLGPNGMAMLQPQTNNAEIWNPATGQWTNDASAAIGRFYHSTTTLLADGTILSAGGGAPGPLVNLNSEIYTPGYLLNADGSLRTDRPVITERPEHAAAGSDVYDHSRQCRRDPEARTHQVWRHDAFL